MRYHILFVIIFIFSVKILFAQSKHSDPEIEVLFKKINMYDESKDHISIVKTLIEILKLDPYNMHANSQFISVVKLYIKEIFEDPILFEEVLKFVKVPSKLPIANIIAFYYSQNSEQKLKDFLFNLYEGNEVSFKVTVNPLFEMDPKLNPDLFKRVLFLIQSNIYEDEKSEFLFLNFLVEPAKDLKEMLNYLNYKLSDLKICSGDNSLKNIEKLYFKKSPTPDVNILNQIEKKFYDCNKSKDPLIMAKYLYENNLYDDLNILIDSTLSAKSNYNVEYGYFLDFDLNKNPQIAAKLFKVLENHLPSFSNSIGFDDSDKTKIALLFNKVGLKNKVREIIANNSIVKKSLITLIQSNQQSLFDLLIGQDELDLILPDFNELQKYDPFIDTLRSKKMLLTYLNQMVKYGIEKFDDKYIYAFCKKCYLVSIDFTQIFDVILNRIDFNSSDFDSFIIWTIVAAYRNDKNKADSLLNKFEDYASSYEKNYLLNELDWWEKNGKKNEVINNHLFKLIDKKKNETNNLFSTTTQIKRNLEEATEDNYFALLIGVESYRDKSMNLLYPLKDLNKIKNVLISSYIFNEKNVVVLSNPERSKIFETFANLKKEIGNNDNLLIFYAGHGYWDEKMEQGYWIPSDATRNERDNWVSNPEIVDLMRGIKSKHTLLIADACFSGSIFVTRKAFYNFNKAFDVAYSKISRKAMTSGANTPVPDKSIFIEYLIKKLKENDSKFLLAETLFLEFREAVTNNSLTLQTPVYGELKGDEGGEFIFIKK